MGPNRRAQERERAVDEASARAKCAAAEQAAVVEAQKIVAIWNARQVEAAEIEFIEREGLSLKWTVAQTSAVWRSRASATCCQALTPLGSPFAINVRIFDFTTEFALTPYQFRHHRAYIAAASSSDTNIEVPNE
jgi:hypothetical protein